MLSHVSNIVRFILTMVALEDQNLDPKLSKKPEQSLQQIANPFASILDLDSFDSHHTRILLMVLNSTSPDWNLDNKYHKKLSNICKQPDSSFATIISQRKHKTLVVNQTTLCLWESFALT